MTENQKMKECEICGRTFPQSYFSKSYKNRCKECVAAQARSERKKKRTVCDQKTIDWEQRRFELVKSAMIGLMAGHYTIHEAPQLALRAVVYADEVVKRLQEDVQQRNVQQKAQKNEDEIYIGDIIEVDGKKYVCKESREDQDCSSCDLCIDDDCKRPYGNCSSDYRKDGKNLIFFEKGDAE